MFVNLILQSNLESKWLFVTNLMEFPQGVPDMSRSKERDGQHKNIMSPPIAIVGAEA